MASIVGKKFGGQTYYYLREMARVGGKPKMVSERYLGKAADIEAAMAGATVEPERTRHLAFGDLAAVWGMIERLDVAGIVDEVVASRRSDAAASVGTYVALATANRVVDPCSKLAFGDWWAATAADRWVRLPAAALDHRRFWDAMDAISAKHLREIERRLTARVVETFGIDLSGLVLDMTNFATYIDSANQRASIAQRGHAKQKRADLRLVGLGLVVSTDGGIPLLSHTYAGDRPDVTQFAAMVNELVTRWGALAADTDDLTLVYDAGQDSVANQALIEATSLHFVGSLPPSDFPDLLAVPASRFRPVGDAYPGVTAFETRVVALGTERRVVVVHSPTLHAKQVAGFTQTLTKAAGRLSELAERLARGKTRRGRAAVEAEIAQVLAPRWVSRVVTATLAGDGPATFELTWSIDAAARRALESEQFGKRILFTDHDHWSHARVIAGYRSQSEVEADFRQMKDPTVVGFSPMFHWTDQKIRVHAFYCVVALGIARLLRRQAAQAGHPMSVRELLATLAGIQETVLIYPSTGGRPRARRMTTEMDATQARLYELFGLAAYAPARP
ncbi:MAG: IS1634 family transposase [Actinomycetota bacterium]|nr:IS1634 family transposase [Actinomycetota bacterium]MDQ3781564.1 IS1634 family transposase [Actinomycetota bacterium]